MTLNRSVSMEKPGTPEEKLLRLIRKKSSVAKGQHPEGNLRRSGGADRLTIIRRLLSAAIGLLLIWLMIKTFILQPSGPGDIPRELGEAIVQGEKHQHTIVPDFRSFDTYQTSFQGRDIFQFPWEKDESPGVTAGSTPDIKEKFRILGIVLDEDPKVIVEDIRNAQTYFISPGESLDGAVLESIQDNKVIFMYQGRSVELSP